MRIKYQPMSHEVVTVGGGTGSPVVNEALLRTGEVNKIDAIAAVYDSGGATGRRRLDARGQELAYSDAMRILLSLVSPDQIDARPFLAIKKLLNHRDESGRVLGHEVFNHFSDTAAGFSEIEEIITDLGLTLKGRVLPSSTQPSNITFITQSGRIFTGEHFLDDQRMSEDMVTQMHLDPSVDAYTAAADAIAEAELIILSCGSLYGSVLSNFLPNGMREALAKSTAPMLLVTNLVSTRNETHGLKPIDLVNLVEQYSGKRPDGLIVPEMTRDEFESEHAEAARLYALEGAHFLGWGDKELQIVQNEGVQVFTHQATSVIEADNNYQLVRHDPKKLANTLKVILPK